MSVERFPLVTDPLSQPLETLLRPGYDQVHVAILQALDEMRGVPKVRWLWGQPVSAALVHRWLFAQQHFPTLGAEARRTPCFRQWAHALERATNDPRPITGNCPEGCWCVVSQIAFEFRYCDEGGQVDEAAFVAAVGRWAQQQAGAR